MDKTHPLSTPIVVQSCDAMKVPFHHQDNEEILDLGVPYLSAINAHMYLANYKTWHGIFSKLVSKIVLHQLEKIGIRSSIYYVTSMRRFTWDYFIQIDLIHIWLDMQVKVIFLIYKKDKS